MNTTPAARARLVLLPLALLLAACGDSAPPPPPPEPLPAAGKAPEAKPSFDAGKAAVALAVRKVQDLLDSGKPEEAEAALDAVAALPGVDAGTVAKLRVALEAARKVAADRAATASVMRLLRDTVDEQEPTARAALLEKNAVRLRTFLAEHAGHEAAEEILAAAEAAEVEARKNRDFAEAFDAARTAVDDGRMADAIAAAERAFAALPRQEARDLREAAMARGAPEGMVFIPAGPAPVGSRNTSTPVQAFYIDRTEVTCGAYATFLRETGHPAPEGWIAGTPPSGRASHPVTSVSGEDAAAYAKWAGKRIPTEIEWEKAARGPEGRKYPWGGEWDEEKGNFGTGGTVPAGNRPGDQSWYGVLDMGGNVSEITAIAIPFPDPKMPYAPGEEPRWSVKGGHWGGAGRPEDAALWLRIRFRGGEKDRGIGFRCVRDVEKR